MNKYVYIYIYKYFNKSREKQNVILHIKNATF